MQTTPCKFFSNSPISIYLGILKLRAEQSKATVTYQKKEENSQNLIFLAAVQNPKPNLNESPCPRPGSPEEAQT